MAKAKVGQAKTDTDEVQMKMQKALDDIKSIIADLENMREISMGDLDELGRFNDFLLDYYFFFFKNTLFFRQKTQHD